MGHQSRMIDGMLNKYVLSTHEAHARVNACDSVLLGDDLDDAVYGLTTDVDVPPASAIARLRAIRDQISAAIDAIEQYDWRLKQ